MKRVLYLPMIGMLLVLTGCPVGIKYPLGNPGTESIDKDLIGEWTYAYNDTVEVMKFELTAGDKNSYNVKVKEKGDMYSLGTMNLTGWVTKLDGKNFVYSKADEDIDYYLYCYEFRNINELYVYDVSLLVGGVDAVTSTETFRNEVSASLKNPNCLTSLKIYKRVK